MRIDWLRDHPQYIDAVAAAHVEAFGALVPDWSVADAVRELRSHIHACAIPTTLLALDGAGDWLGSASLLQEDHRRIRQYSPWLASLYVRPQARGQGVGAALVARCVDEAAALGVGRLYLYCTAALTGYYARLGWRGHSRVVLGPLHVDVMAIDCAGASR
ncbi:GNAT family N-acetyltransferase [Pseudoxanthomonas koreensis]|uniref:GNAT family N-acetyltransferase n=1 Tax=Pseudoxanthomonas koreensis TaxID=266061 RepID=UPI001391B1D0|nr:GNAT family N-acetyltransferase [Pseudoxanthomonas koreensis]KAF1691509.1 GNAT family N-acetyltransferase [Pseudoxanthomonas koreensis]